jgi:large subunit ribosomal protein L24
VTAARSARFRRRHREGVARDEGVKGVEGKVSDVNTKTGRIIIEGITMPKADGTMKARPVHSSNVIITKLELKDNWRKEKLFQRKEEGSA